MEMCFWEDKLEGKTAYFRLPSASQKRVCLSSLLRNHRRTIARDVTDRTLFIPLYL